MDRSLADEMVWDFEDNRSDIAIVEEVLTMAQERIAVATPSPQLPSGISMTTTWVPWYDILLFFLRVGLTKIWELGTDPIAIRGSAVLEGHV